MGWPQRLSHAALLLVIVLDSSSVLHAQPSTGAGLITTVDLATNTLVLETRSGPQRIRVAATATVRGDNGAVVPIRDLRPGDAVAFHTVSDVATIVWVARQFWAVPPER